MTAVVIPGGTGVRLLCDGCGAVAGVDSCGLHDMNVGYVAVATIGWRGSTFARGPHHCPACRAPRRRMTEHDTHTARMGLAVTDAAAIVRLGGVIGATSTSPLHAVVQQAVAARRTVIVDLSTVRSDDAAGPAALVYARNIVLHRGGELLLAAPPRPLRARLRLLRLQPAFRIYGSVQHAITVTQSRTGSAVNRAAARPDRVAVAIG